MIRREPAKSQILEEIELLKRELDARRKAPRPAPESVVRAYQQLLLRQYERLDRTDPE